MSDEKNPHCGGCGTRLTDKSPSRDFCSEPCYRRWVLKTSDSDALIWRSVN